MTRSLFCGTLAGATVAVCGFVVLAHDQLARAGASPTRFWNLLQFLGIDPPAPLNPWLASLTLALLNAQLWLLIVIFGSALAGAFWAVRAIDHDWSARRSGRAVDGVVR